MQKIFLTGLLILLYFTVMSNNIKIDGEAKVVAFTGVAKDTAIVEFNLSWENSWRDDFNWDAAWIFLKYKKRGITEVWNHAYLTRVGHEVLPQSGNEGGNYTFMFGEVGSASNAKVTGLYLMRDGVAEGNVKTKIRVKWPIKSNSNLSLNASDFGLNKDSIYVAAYAAEMVYVPYGGYFLGDDHSANTYQSGEQYGPIPESEDIINVNSGYEMSASNPAEGSTASNVAKHINASTYSPSVHSLYAAATPAWWQIDFKTPKTVRFFGISGSMTYPSNYIPTSTWRLEGSNDAVNWRTLNELPASWWRANTISYPVQNSIKVKSPGAYRYYRFYFPSGYIITENIAMSEGDLYDVQQNVIVVNSEESIKLFDKAGATTLPQPYPKGYRGFYMMKYEVSQEQYVEFLNSLTLAQQKNRVANNNFSTMVKGDYVFGGDLKHPAHRNGIAYIMSMGVGGPAAFGNNLNPDNAFFSEDDGQTLACNYLSPADMLAYCDWSGLRPMSELEYEKACRRPYPQIPEKGEYAWNENIGVTPVTKLSDLTGEKTERETPFNYKMNVNSGGKLDGPVRSGAFATSRTSQREAGASYWGVMELSGNVWEMCYNTTATGMVFKGDDLTNSHGDGNITDAGANIAAAYWPVTNTALAVRGGSYATGDTVLRSSDRTYATGNYFSSFTQRDATVGFRGVRSILNGSGFNPGRIYCQNNQVRDTTCGGIDYTIKGEPAGNAIGKTTYLWYVSLDNGTSWSMLEGETGLGLTYGNLSNTTTVAKIILFKRKVTCAVGEETSAVVSLVVPATFAAPALEDAAAIAVVGQTLTLTMPAAPSGTTGAWIHPDGHYTNGVTLTIPSFTLEQAGIYYATYSGGKCEGNRKAIEIYPYQEVGKQVFYYTGREQIASVVGTATHVRAYLIGASGGIGSYSSYSLSSGAGGYTDAVFPANDVANVGVIVGQGGGYAAKGGRTTAAYPNGGIGQGGDVGPGGGGGRSQVRNVSNNSLVAIAGAGGGCNSYSGSAGAGGGLVGGNGSGYTVATGGTQSAGGGPVAGGYLQGANAANNSGYDSGGGGDGYYGGGTVNGDGQPAGGGSGYINRNICIMGKTYTGNVAARPTQVATIIAGYATGSYGIGVTGQNLTGNNGMVVLQYLKRLTK